VDTRTFGQRLKERRVSQGMTQADLARKSATSSSSISHFENGRNDPSLATLQRLADCLSCSLNWLVLGNEGEETEKVQNIKYWASRIPEGQLKILENLARDLYISASNKD